MDFVEAWRSGTVKRFHVMETIEPNSVSSHTWGVVLILIMMWPSATREIIISALLHDFGERKTGDMPGPVKWDNPVLESEMDRMERAHLKETLPPELAVFVEDLSEVGWALIEMCDRAEFCIRMIHERMMGNKYAETYYKRAWDRMTAVLEQHREKFREASDELFIGIIAMRQNLDENWRKARGNG